MASARMGRKKTPDRITLDIHGVRFAVTSTSSAATNLLSDRFHGYVSKPGDAFDATVAIDAAPSLILPSKIRRQFWVSGVPSVWGDFQNGIVRITDGRSVAITHHGDRKIEFLIHPDLFGGHPSASRRFFVLPIAELLRTFGFFPAHGSLVLKGRRGILLLGQNGSGKSTLAAALLAKGWKIVDDDILLLRLDSGTSCVGFPWNRQLKIPKKAADQLQLRGQPLEGKNKIGILLSQIPKNRAADCAVPTQVVGLTGKDSDSTHPLSPWNVFEILIQGHFFLPFLRSPSLTYQHFQTIRALIRNARCTGLSLAWKHPLDLKEIASRFLRLVGD